MFQWSGPHGGDRPCAKHRRNEAAQTDRQAVETRSHELWRQTQLHDGHDLNHSHRSRGDCRETGRTAGQPAQSPQCGLLRYSHFARLVSNDLDHAQNIDPDDLARRSLKSKGIRNQFAALRVMGWLGQRFRSGNDIRRKSSPHKNVTDAGSLDRPHGAERRPSWRQRGACNHTRRLHEHHGYAPRPAHRSPPLN